jgi:hypothetical protein
MAISATTLRANVYKVLDEVLETGVPVEIERNGQRLRIVPMDGPRAPRRRLDNLTPHPGAIVGDPQDLVEIDWSVYWNPDPT